MNVRNKVVLICLVVSVSLMIAIQIYHSNFIERERNNTEPALPTSLPVSSSTSSKTTTPASGEEIRPPGELHQQASPNSENSADWLIYRNEHLGYEFRYPRQYKSQRTEIKLLTNAVELRSPEIYPSMRGGRLISYTIEIGQVSDPIYLRDLEDYNQNSSNAFISSGGVPYLQLDSKYIIKGDQLIASKDWYCLVTKPDFSKVYLIIPGEFMTQEEGVQQFYGAVKEVCDTFEIRP